MKLFWKLLETFINILWLICPCAAKHAGEKSSTEVKESTVLCVRCVLWNFARIQCSRISIRIRIASHPLFSLHFADIPFVHNLKYKMENQNSVLALLVHKTITILHCNIISYFIRFVFSLHQTREFPLSHTCPSQPSFVTISLLLALFITKQTYYILFYFLLLFSPTLNDKFIRVENCVRLPLTHG